MYLLGPLLTLLIHMLSVVGLLLLHVLTVRMYLVRVGGAPTGVLLHKYMY